VSDVRSPSTVIEGHVEVQRLGTCVYVEFTGTVHGIAVHASACHYRLHRKVTWCDIVKYRHEVVTMWDSLVEENRWNHRHRHRLSTAATCQLPAPAARFCRRLVSLWTVCWACLILYLRSGLQECICEFPCKRFGFSICSCCIDLRMIWLTPTVNL